MKKVVLFVLAISVVIISCYKSVPGNLTYSINTSGDSTVPTVYMPQTGSYNLPLEVKYLAGYSEDLVTISISGLPSGIKITPDSFTAVPTYSANFVLSDSNVALGTYTATITSNTSSTGRKTQTFNVVVIPPNCATTLLGTLTGTNACTARNYSYTATASGSGTNSMVINNFGGYGSNVNVTVNLNCTNNTLTIPAGNYGNNTILSGTGTFTATSMTINYVATSTPLGFGETCTATLTK